MVEAERVTEPEQPRSLEPEPENHAVLKVEARSWAPAAESWQQLSRQQLRDSSDSQCWLWHWLVSKALLGSGRGPGNKSMVGGLGTDWLGPCRYEEERKVKKMGGWIIIPMQSSILHKNRRNGQRIAFSFEFRFFSYLKNELFWNLNFFSCLISGRKIKFF